MENIFPFLLLTLFLLVNEHSAGHYREKDRTGMALALQKLKVWKGNRNMSNYLCNTLSRRSIYLHRVLEELQGGAPKPNFHSPGGSRGGFREVVIPKDA